MAAQSKPPGVKEVRDYFNSPGVTGNQRDMTLPDMKAEWVKGLNQAEREQIATGIADGSLTYGPKATAEKEAA